MSYIGRRHVNLKECASTSEIITFSGKPLVTVPKETEVDRKLIHELENFQFSKFLVFRSTVQNFMQRPRLLYRPGVCLRVTGSAGEGGLMPYGVRARTRKL